jgi:hypothetical protein
MSGKFLIQNILIVLFIALFQTSTGQVSREEFVGPFNSWANIKTRFGAKGDGKTDDTKAFQQALDSLTYPANQFNTNAATRYCVIYIPKGVYRISKTLLMKRKQGVAFVGEDPSNTVIKWDGADNDTTFWSDCSGYMRLARLRWDANGHKGCIAIGLNWKTQYFDGPRPTPLNIEITDMIFDGGWAKGIAGGTYNDGGVQANDSEVTIKRCQFNACTETGIFIKGYNALDYWIWNCDFKDCRIGVLNNFGNYHVYRSNFYNSARSDIVNLHGYYTSVRGCYSSNSLNFSLDTNGNCNPFKRIFQDNVVHTRSYPIFNFNMGKITLLNNKFYKHQTAAKENFVVGYYTFPNCYGKYRVLSVKNQYEGIKRPIDIQYNKDTAVYADSDVNEVADIKSSKANSAENKWAFQPFVKRKIFDVPDRANSKQIQRIIDDAAKLKGSRPVIHFGMGAYTVDETLQVPANSDIQFVGDGLINVSVLWASIKTPNASVFKISGPSYVSFRDFHIATTPKFPKANGFEFVNIDQSGAEFHIDQIVSESEYSLYVDGLDNAYIEKDNCMYANGNIIIGGPKTNSGKGKSSVCAFGGQFAHLKLDNGASFTAKDCWWEGVYKKNWLPIDLQDGRGNFTLDGAMIAPPDLDSTTTIRINNFKGRVTLMDLYMYGGIEINSQNKDLKAMVWNVQMNKKHEAFDWLNPNKFDPQCAFIGITSDCSKEKCVNYSFTSYDDMFLNIEKDEQKKFINEMIGQNLRSMPVQFRNLEKGTTNVEISRVMTGALKYGYVLKN